MNTTQNTKTKSTIPVLAICYDFDRTLTPDDMQAQGYIQDIGKKTTSDISHEIRNIV